MFKDATRKQILSMMETVDKMKSYCINKEDYSNLEMLYKELKMESFYHEDILNKEQNIRQPHLLNIPNKEQKAYSITQPYLLRKLCIDNSLFTSADNIMYEKFMSMNENNASFDWMVSFAYACSEDSLEHIESLFKQAKEDYQAFFEQQDEYDRE